MGRSASRRPGLPGRSTKAPRGAVGVLHRLAALLVLTNHLKTKTPKGSSRATVHDRRRRQRMQLVDQLVEANVGLHQLRPRTTGAWLWQGLRWGAPWLLVGWLLAQAASS